MKRNNPIKISASVLAALEKSKTDPVLDLLKIANKPDISINLRTKILQDLLKYLYPRMVDHALLESQYQTAQLHVYDLMEKLTVEEVKRLANMPIK